MKSRLVFSTRLLVRTCMLFLLAFQLSHRANASELGLPPLKSVQAVNPYHGNRAIRKIGYKLYTDNCSQCHGVDAISEGKAPDLRFLPAEKYGDTLYLDAVINGKKSMPAYKDKLTQEEIWAIRTWVETMPNGDE